MLAKIVLILYNQIQRPRVVFSLPSGIARGPVPS